MGLPATTTEGPLNTQNWAALSSFLIIGVGAPENAVKGCIGAIFLRTDGEAGTTLYAKESGEGTAQGWVAVNSPITASNLAASAKELFPQLVTPESRKINFGTATLKWLGSAFSETLEINHGLGVEPKTILFAPEKFESIFLYATYKEVNSTRFKVDALANAVIGSGKTSKLGWLAIG